MSIFLCNITQTDKVKRGIIASENTRIVKRTKTEVAKMYQILGIFSR